MREIIFRCWDILKTKMVYSNSQESADEMGLDVGDKLMANFMKRYYGDLCLEQYTSLSDKNGNPIFEGDVVECAPDCERGKVIFSRGCFLFELLADSNDQEYLHDLSLEVIGNIHQNPDLLN